MRSPPSLQQYLHRTLIGQILTNHKRLTSGILLGLVIVSALCVYLISPYWEVRKLQQALYSQDSLQLHEKIPKKLLSHLVINDHPDQKWRGAGKKYLQHVLPKLYGEIDRYAWLSLQAQMLSKVHKHQYYQSAFNHYALELGDSPDQIRFELTRDHLIDWHVTRICYPSPQPDRVSNRCPSSKR